MNEAIRGKGSKLYMGTDNTTELTKENYVSHVTNIGAFSNEFNLIDVDAELDAEYEEKIAGLKNVVTISLTGNFRQGESENEGYKVLKANHDAQKLVKFGIVRPGVLDGVGGSCLVNQVEVTEATNEGLMQWNATLTTSGPRVAFTEPVEE